MDTIFYSLSLGIVLAPLFGAIIAGVLGQRIGKSGAHWVTIIGIAISFILSLIVCKYFVFDNALPYNQVLYIWGSSGNITFEIGFLLDQLSTIIAVVVTGVSLLVHIYSIGYMRDDPGYQRFFCYMSLFTFSMLMLVLANNFMQLFFGWEGVGLVSYLLIGFWFHRESANLGSLKAFIVNRIGDIGFILGIAAILGYFDTLDYATVFSQAPALANSTIELFPGVNVGVFTMICVLLLIGAMGKSAQMPLHVWLPESMEGPTPISALIHAATMVTAGIFMIVRTSPLFVLSPTALSLVLIVGATTALFMGLVAFVQNDIKRIIAYSTLSQLGYMVAALGATAFSASIFHLITHAYFKALLFLAAGSVILAMHHEQDIRKMGGLRKYMPITYITFLIGALSMSAVPPFSGFYSKESIIEAVKLTTIAGGSYAYFCLVVGAFVTAFYIFRALFLTFHTEERMDENVRAHIKESPWVVSIPLILLAIPSAIIGVAIIIYILSSHSGLLGSLLGNGAHDSLTQLTLHGRSPWLMAFHAIYDLAFWFALAGIVTAWLFYIVWPWLPNLVTQRFFWLYKILVIKYGFDEFYQKYIVRGTRGIAQWLYSVTDIMIIDHGLINGSGRVVNWFSKTARRLQSGYIYQYALVMVIGLLVLMLWLLR